jgi:hypothetical protein
MNLLWETFGTLEKPMIKTTAFIFVVAFVSLLQMPPAGAEMALKRISDPNGGRIMYGQVEGQTTEAGAMAAVLRQIHTTWGDEPQVGRFFRVRNTDSIATFITGVNHSQGDLQSAGLVIVSQVAPQRIEAALLVDSVQHFDGNINSMLGELFQQWHPAPADSATAGGAPSAAEGSRNEASVTPAAPLTRYSLPDGSASALMPEGWQVTPASGKGTIFFKGPNQEMVTLGFTMLPLNINDPRVLRTRQFAMGAGRNTVYGQSLYYPYGQDLTKTYIDLVDMTRTKYGLPQATRQISSQTALSAPPGWRQVYIVGVVDAQDGVGPRETHSLVTCAPPGPAGGFMVFASESSVPVRLADQERETVLAMISSFSVNQQVVSAQASAIAAPEIARIHEIGRRAAAQAASAHAMEDAHNAAVERHWDSMDKQSQSFSNYLLDQSVITDSRGNHATVSNGTADAMVRSNPSRYEYVNTLNLKKGVDY